MLSHDFGVLGSRDVSVFGSGVQEAASGESRSSADIADGDNAAVSTAGPRGSDADNKLESGLGIPSLSFAILISGPREVRSVLGNGGALGDPP